MPIVLKRSTVVACAAVAALVLVSGTHSHAQARAPAWAVWEPALPVEAPAGPVGAPAVALDGERKSHAVTGLLVGATVGALGTLIVLSSVCSDADEDTDCGGSRTFPAKMVVVAIPFALLGAVVGSLIKTRR